MVFTVVALALGAALLAYSADQFVLGAARVALIRRWSPLVVGVVIIGFGTSAPELLVSAIAAGSGDAEVAVGNIVGSNIANLSLLLGVGAIIVPISVASSTVKREAPIAVGAMVAIAAALQGGIQIWEGVLLLVALGAALWFITTSGSAGGSAADPLGVETVELADPSTHSMGREVVRTILGLVGTVAGAQLLLTGALDLADRAGLEEGFVGATLVAIGTSLPELVTVVQSARRRETDLIVGNLLGSNLFNALGVGGLIGLIGASDLDDRGLTVIGAGAAIVIALLALVAMMTRKTVGRAEGIGLVVVYAALVPFLA
ncbi:MAG: sodium:calcium antiporter [Ilumatobacter sp.]|jgi:cation:H+ antiporter|uniref:sodium:calcium antiporter n=1 Tax=Ilumatobacter sp. TaxID=1967498 RepID=UPI0039196F53